MYDPLMCAAIVEIEHRHERGYVTGHPRDGARASRPAIAIRRIARRDRSAPVGDAHGTWRMSVDARA